MRRFISLAVATALATLATLFSLPAEAQQAAPSGGTLVVAYWKCDFGGIGTLIERFDSLSLPIEQELVNEGKLWGAGMLTHDWADEWNVLYWWWAEEKVPFFEARAEFNRRFNERHPNPPSDPGFLEICREHRDGIYNEAAGTAAVPDIPAEQSTLVVSYWKCDLAGIGDMVAQYDSLSVPIQEELVGEGMLIQAGLLTHDWADEWNVMYWWHAKDKAAFFAEQDEENRRFSERHPNPPDPQFLDVCHSHYDAIYNWVSATTPPPVGGEM